MKTDNKNWKRRELSLDFWNHLYELASKGQLTMHKIALRRESMKRKPPKKVKK